MSGHGRLLGVWAQQMAQEAVGARAGERISRPLGVLAMRTLRDVFGAGAVEFVLSYQRVSFRASRSSHELDLLSISFFVFFGFAHWPPRLN